MSFLSYTVDITFLLVLLLDFSQQNSKFQETNFDNESITNLCKFLIKTDQMLDKQYRARPKGNGEMIMKMVQNYNKAMALIVARSIDDLNQRKNLTISEAKDLIDHGGPEFINFHVDTPLLEELFSLNETSAKILQQARQHTIVLWQDFFKCCSRIPDEDDVSYV